MNLTYSSQNVTLTETCNNYPQSPLPLSSRCQHAAHEKSGKVLVGNGKPPPPPPLSFRCF